MAAMLGWRAMVEPFLIVASSAGAPLPLAAPGLAFFSNINRSPAHYGTRPASICYGAGYTDLKRRWGIGFVASLVSVVNWTEIGPSYRKAPGLF